MKKLRPLSLGIGSAAILLQVLTRKHSLFRDLLGMNSPDDPGLIALQTAQIILLVIAVPMLIATCHQRIK